MFPSGSLENRPSRQQRVSDAEVGRRYFDSVLGKPYSMRVSSGVTADFSESLSESVHPFKNTLDLTGSQKVHIDVDSPLLTVHPG